MRIVLVCTDPTKQLGGHERVGVTAGGEDEAHWVSLGYSRAEVEETAETEMPQPAAVPEEPDVSMADLRKQYRAATRKPPGRRNREALEAGIAEALTTEE